MSIDAPPNRSTYSSEPILTVDQDSAIVAANPAACRMLGAAEEALRGAPFLARVVGEERQAAGMMLADGFRGRTVEASLLLHGAQSGVQRFLVRVIPVLRDDDVPRLLLMLRGPSAERREQEEAGEQPTAIRPVEAELRTFDAVVRAAWEGADTPRSNAVRAAAEGRSPIVLVIDDDEALRATMRRSLEAGGYRVLEATSGRHALAQLREGCEVDLLVTDLKMEDGSGGWLLAQLAYERPELLRCTVVVAGDAGSTGAAHVASRWRCPVLGKPFSRDQLVDAVAALARDSREPAVES
jgi:CheY-like chemotaxis protein